jgi:hypothetical protein
MAEMFQRMGIAAQIKAKLKQTPPDARVAAIIASSEVEIAFQQLSELIRAWHRFHWHPACRCAEDHGFCRRHSY